MLGYFGEYKEVIMETYSNIFYFSRICKIGGTEQFLYEIAKKYSKYDITVFYDDASSDQLKRLKRYVRCKKRTPGQKVKCKKAFLNFNIGMIEDIEAEEIYFVSHANYEELHRAHGGYIPPIAHEKITHYIGVSQFATDKLEEYRKKIGSKIETEKCYNPLTLEKVKRPKIIVSACRLNDKVKGGERTLKLINALDRYCKKNDEHYLWLIFTNPNVKVHLDSPNVVLMQPRIDVRPYIAMADYVVQISNDMETYCYTINEALGYGVPIITTPLSITKELPITENERIELEWDCSNADEVAKKVFEKKVEKFNYKIPKDNWDNILVQDKSTYKEEHEKQIKVRAIKNYYDNEEEEHKTTESDPWDVYQYRYEELVNHPRGALVEKVK